MRRSRPAGGSEPPVPPRERPGRARKAAPSHGPGTMADALSAAIDQLAAGARVRENLAMACWARAVGPQAAAATEPDAVRNGTLFVHTRSSVWSQELTLHRDAILAKLNEMLGGRYITGIVYRPRGVRKRQPAPADSPAADELRAVVLEPPEQAELDSRLASLSSVQDNRVREAISTRLRLDARLRHWRLEHGWHVCGRCLAVHNTRADLCPICRLCG